MSVKKIALCGILSALALISFMIENLFPPLLIPGGKIGVANIFVIFAALVLGFKYGLFALTFKSVLGSVFIGNVSAILYSLPAGIISYVLQVALIFYAKRVSIIAASVVGGTVNSILQGITFCIVTATREYVVFIPYLALIGILGGAIVGTTVYLLIKFLPDRFLFIHRSENNTFNNNIKGE